MYVFRRQALVLSSPAHAAGHRLLRTPHAGGALTFLRDQKSKQKSRRECDYPFPTPVGTENRTFPDQQPLPVLRLQGRSREYFLIVQLKTSFRASGRAAASRSGGPVPLGTRAGL